MQPGKFVTFEGVDGTGKTTQGRLLGQSLEAYGIKVLILREPGGTAISEKIRDILLDASQNKMTAETEVLLFEAARAQIVREVIRPALEQGNWVICDRFMDSTVAYQGYGRGLDLELIDKLNDFAVGETKPDLTVLLQLPPHRLAERLEKRHALEAADRLDGESEDFRSDVDRGFRALAAREPERFGCIETQGTKEETAGLVLELVRRVLL
ncbi:MAG: dTMP kinase [Clostridiaceae bacterium]|nr:dTMP kinase [Clostridiaceae bacterium]